MFNFVTLHEFYKRTDCASTIYIHYVQLRSVDVIITHVYVYYYPWAHANNDKLGGYSRIHDRYCNARTSIGVRRVYSEYGGELERAL